MQSMANQAIGSTTDREQREVVSWNLSEHSAEMERTRQRLMEYERSRMFKNEELSSLIRKNVRTSLHTAYEARMFNSRYSRSRAARKRTNAGNTTNAHDVLSDTFAGKVADLAQKNSIKHRRKLKRMQGRNFVVTFFANLVFIPKQMVCSVFEFAIGKRKGPVYNT